MKKRHGFTLIELLIALAIISILITAAIIGYGPYVRKSRRMDGINALLAISLAEERYRSANPSYGTLAQAYNGTATSPDGFYNLAVTNVTTSSYTATATATGDQANDASGGTSCATLTLAFSNGSVTQTPAACWPN